MIHRTLPLCSLLICLGMSLAAKEPVFVIVKIDGPVHNPPDSKWYGPFSEGCAFLDVNEDGKLDITCGANWYENPTWKKHADFRPNATVHGEFVNNCGEYAVDINGDGRKDLVSAGWMQNGVWWYENPGKAGETWKEHKIVDSVWTEGLMVEDLDGDDDRDIVVNHWAKKEGQGVTWLENLGQGRFAIHVLGTEGDEHGMGIGDLNRDGRKDIITPEGWWEAPEDRAAGKWTFHDDFRIGHTSIRVILKDLNGDGRDDLIHGNPHGYGLYWSEQLPPEGDRLRFKKAVLVDESNHSSRGQFHTLVLGDVNQDGKTDLLAGKRLFGHNGSDASAFDPLGVYWYEFRDGKLVWHVLSYNHLFRYDPEETRNPAPICAVGAGMNIKLADYNEDGKVDILVAGKSGCYLFENRGLPPTPKMPKK